MSYRRLFVLVFVCALAFAAPALLQAAGGGAATHIDENNVCYWRCNNGTGGSAQMGPLQGGRACRDLCSAACGGPCIALY